MIEIFPVVISRGLCRAAARRGDGHGTDAAVDVRGGEDAVQEAAGVAIARQ